MSSSIRASKRENDCPDDAVVDNHCELCGEYESECICADVATEGHAPHPAEDVGPVERLLQGFYPTKE